MLCVYLWSDWCCVNLDSVPFVCDIVCLVLGLFIYNTDVGLRCGQHVILDYVEVRDYTGDEWWCARDCVE